MFIFSNIFFAKPLNSFKAITRAIEAEKNRQIDLLEEGKEVIQETRRWDDVKEYSYAMRSKEDAQDYRYFPEPDLVPVEISDAWIARIKAAQPELQPEKMERYQREYGLPQYDAEIITASKHLADIFEETAELCKKPKKVSNWLMGETMRLMKEKEMDAEELRFSPGHLAELIVLTEDGSLSNTVAKEVFEKIFEEDIEPGSYVKEHGLNVVNDEGELRNAAGI